MFSPLTPYLLPGKPPALSHHAFAIAGERRGTLDALRVFFERELRLTTVGNPDFSLAEHDVFGIDDCRELKRRQAQSGIQGGAKIFVVAADSITGEAQNSLLKVLEEPAGRTYIFLIVPTFDILLSTVRSRVVEVGAAARQNVDDTTRSLADDFLQTDIAARETLLAPLVKDGDKAKTARFLDALEVCMRERNEPARMGAGIIFLLDEITACRRYIRGRAPSVKTILGHISIIAPVAGV